MLGQVCGSFAEKRFAKTVVSPSVVGTKCRGGVHQLAPPVHITPVGTETTLVV